ncbi:MAG: hypothetical protein A3B74_02755 [Candidatus Kerfeldbacteria bacterium RIFCSPHIGHO2_02_FULL_42_14]|uniref:Uncharacterized protein n=1 Tax=Candidatus Kerfeldbacteria bacterium RIFCSPHIGHO2_02_FULL_42_14 TaxID=1798540 RepID=A0A1G2ARY8_9BACT|nr:MAG: hypothetical protein A3B74_02755 [Candidatus Kerfeldbacteria bacterium RIFCSPHIGHO2_02_FULL_42_14]OGY80460.1 MAG: hypothetical protein A3E60_05375 [Candidatus Kerfeldbacteria bacterium RIFCSPHIGHO2_12_FULL_42_13]OGY83890.1 MAG: hypothetical protein A3I91_04900 [Candidatus Kerfeldbacteria bacterium RIFCSPLOWO2_02_FULL_42_19]OGY86571.1 MAG: hypothetical protein A3G01_04930 [Candidatus Kerfeldbacteria bacterium RIFCSPLOWO2_12_FULL_43_9]
MLKLDIFRQAQKDFHKAKSAIPVLWDTRRILRWFGTSTIIIALGFIAYFWLFSRGNQMARDLERVTHIQMVQTALEMLFQDEYSYLTAAVGCEQEGMPVKFCNLKEYLPNIDAIQDPGDFEYIVQTVPTKTTYAIRFTLERGVGNLGAGEHTLTPNGIQ